MKKRLLTLCWACGSFGLALVCPAEEPSRPLTLSEALALASRSNETAAIAAVRVQKAEALRREAYATLLPSLTAQGTYTRRSQQVIRTINDQTVVVQAENALSGFGQIDLTLFDARAYPVAKSFSRRFEAQENESAELKRNLAFDVAQNFFAVLSAERLRGAADRRIQVAETTVSDARTKLEAGLASQNELTRSELELASARLAQTQAQDIVRTTRLTLGYLIGVEAESRPLEEPPPQSVSPASAAERDQAVASRQDLRALELRAEAARLLAEEPWLRLVPTLGLRGVYKGTNEPGLNGKERDWNVAATLTWVLFDGGVRYAEAAARKADFLEATYTVDALRRRIALEIRIARTNLDTARAALSQAEVASRVAAQNEEEVRVRFGQGLATALEQADATVSAFEADAALARQRFALRIAQLSLVKALGRRPGEEIPSGSLESSAAESTGP